MDIGKTAFRIIAATVVIAVIVAAAATFTRKYDQENVIRYERAYCPACGDMAISDGDTIICNNSTCKYNGIPVEIFIP